MTSAAHRFRGRPASSAKGRVPGGVGCRRREPRTQRSGLWLADVTAAVKIATAVVAPLVCALGVLGAIGSFATVSHLAVPWFGSSAWIVPVGVDIGILALLAWDLLTEYLGLPWPVLRWTAWAFIAATTYLNVAAAHGNLTASVMHAAMPILFIIVIEGIRHLIKQCTGLATGTRIERIPLSRWLLAPRTTFTLGRRMVLWHVTSYQDGLRLEYQRLLAVSRLQQAYGRWLWRWRAPLQDRLALRLTPTMSAVDGNQEVAATRPVQASALLGLLPRQHTTKPPQSANKPTSQRDERLVAAAEAILREADRQNIQLCQAALARKLRAGGYRFANDRLQWLMIAAGSTPEAAKLYDLVRGRA